MDDSKFADTNMLFAYSRAQAITDGMLIDLSDVAPSYGFKVPVAITAAAWLDAVRWDENDDRRQPNAGQSQRGRLHDLLFVAAYSASGLDADVLHFPLLRVPREGRSVVARETRLKMVIGPGDTPAPVITIMLHNED